jgi:hypothetical protein
MQIKIQIFLSINIKLYKPIIIFKNKKIDITSNIILVDEIQNNDNIFEFHVSNIMNNSSEILIQKILINGIEANLYHNTSFIMKNNEYVENKRLTSIHRIDFNGIYQLKVNEEYLEPLRSQHWHVSNNNFDYIFNYIFSENIFDLIYRPRNHKKIFSDSICVLGDSFTYGSGLDNSDTWPVLLEEKIKLPVMNLAVPGAGIDLIYNNYKKLVKEYNFKKIIINFPNMERRLIRCCLEGKKFYKVPTSFVPMDSNNPWLYANYETVKIRRKKIEKKIINDINFFYSKKILKKIINLSKKQNIKTFYTSRDNYTYSYIKSNYEDANMLPKYPQLTLFKERAKNGTHPAGVHNEYFVKEIIHLI